MSICKLILQAILVAQHGNQIIFEGEDDEEKCESAKVEAYVEEIVPRFSDMQFKQHFRMIPTTFEDFLQKLHMVSMKETVKVGHPELPLEKRAMLTLWCLANTESFR